MIEIEKIEIEVTDTGEDNKGLEELLQLSEADLDKLAKGFKNLLSTGNMYLVKDQTGSSGRFSEQGVMSIQLQGVPPGKMINLIAGIGFFIQVISFFGEDVSAKRLKTDEKYDSKIKFLWSKLKELNAVSDFLYQANTLGNRIIGATVFISPKLVPISPGSSNVYPCADLIFGTSMGSENTRERFEIGIADMRILIDKLKRAEVELENLHEGVIGKTK